jgi:SAM-dependent methyltransferase
MRYVADVPYTRRFFKELTPAWLDFTARICGFEPRPCEGVLQWCELGCGTGVSAALLAGMHAGIHVTAIDMMPEHIAYGEALRREAGIDNITFLALDFAAACARDLPRFDAIVAHGVYTWVDEAAKADLRRFIARHLKPGGFVYLSYNCLPGWAADMPLQHLLSAFAEQAEGGGFARFQAADRHVSALAEAGAHGLRDGPVGRDWARLRETLPEAYFPHEFLVPWRPIYVTEMRRDMAALGLTPIGSATLRENVDAYVLKPGARAALANLPDPDLRELARDYFLNKTLRRDVFALQPRRVGESALRDRILETPMMLSQSPETTEYTMATAAGTVGFDTPTARRIVEFLAAGPQALAGVGDAKIGDLTPNLLALAAADRIRPVAAVAHPTAALNAAIRRRLNGPEAVPFLALPHGTAIELGRDALARWASRGLPPEFLHWTGLHSSP